MTRLINAFLRHLPNHTAEKAVIFTNERMESLVRLNQVLREEVRDLKQQRNTLINGITEVGDQRDAFALELAQIRGTMTEVAVYEGIVDSSPLAMLVAEIVRDHEELESRIDAVMHYLKAIQENHVGFAIPTITVGEVVQEVSRLLGGGVRVPDSPEGLT